LRQHGIINVKDVKSAILEVDGEISVVAADAKLPLETAKVFLYNKSTAM